MPREREAETTTERYERLVDALDGRYLLLDTTVGSRVVAWIEDAGLDMHQARVLLALADARRAMRPSKIARRAGLDLDTTYRALHALHGRGLTDETRRRHCLSARGRDMMRSFAHARRKGVRAYLRRLGRTDLRRMETVLRPE